MKTLLEALEQSLREESGRTVEGAPPSERDDRMERARRALAGLERRRRMGAEPGAAELDAAQEETIEALSRAYGAAVTAEARRRVAAEKLRYAPHDDHDEHGDGDDASVAHGQAEDVSATSADSSEAGERAEDGQTGETAIDDEANVAPMDSFEGLMRVADAALGRSNRKPLRAPRLPDVDYRKRPDPMDWADDDVSESAEVDIQAAARFETGPNGEVRPITPATTADDPPLDRASDEAEQDPSSGQGFDQGFEQGLDTADASGATERRADDDWADDKSADEARPQNTSGPVAPDEAVAEVEPISAPLAAAPNNEATASAIETTHSPEPSSASVETGPSVAATETTDAEPAPEATSSEPPEASLGDAAPEASTSEPARLDGGRSEAQAQRRAALEARRARARAARQTEEERRLAQVGEMVAGAVAARKHRPKRPASPPSPSIQALIGPTTRRDTRSRTGGAPLPKDADGATDKTIPGPSEADASPARSEQNAQPSAPGGADMLSGLTPEAAEALARGLQGMVEDAVAKALSKTRREGEDE